MLTSEETIDGTTTDSNTFRTTDVGRDVAHWANGTASTVVSGDKEYLQLGSDFEAGLAPDLYVYISDDPTRIVDETTFWSNGGVTELAKLKRGEGASYYELPEGFDVKSVTIWCKRFGAFIASTNFGE